MGWRFQRRIPICKGVRLNVGKTGTGISFGVSWLELEVVRELSGRPTLRFHGRAAQIAARLGVARAALSLTHTATLAQASVVLED